MLVPQDVARGSSMAGTAATRAWLVPMAALFATIFCVGTSELIVLALLPNLAADLAVDIPTAGLLISGYAIGVAVASPVLTLLTNSIPRRQMLLLMLAVFVAGNVICAVSTAYWMLLVARLIVACCHGVVFGVTMVIAMRIAPEGRQTTVMSVLVSGFTVATIFGVPVGTAVGHAFGWRASFWIIAVVGALAAVVVVVLIPREIGLSAKRSNLQAELRSAVRPVVLIAFVAIIFYMTGVFTLYTYLIPLMTTVSGIPIDYVPLMLFGMGFVGFFGNLASGRLADWKFYPTVFGILISISVLQFLLSQLATYTWWTVLLLLLSWCIGFGFAAPMRTRIVRAASDAPNFTSTLTSTAFNVGIAAGAAVGGAAIAAGSAYTILPLIGAGFSCLALLATLALRTYEHRTELRHASA